MFSEGQSEITEELPVLQNKISEINPRKICQVGAQSDVVFTQTTFNKTLFS